MRGLYVEHAGNVVSVRKRELVLLQRKIEFVLLQKEREKEIQEREREKEIKEREREWVLRKGQGVNVEHVGHVVAPEGREPAEHRVEDHPDRPYVHLVHRLVFSV